jgi:hypothetical protein
VGKKMSRKYKQECIEELKRYIDITADECCKECEICCESNNCILTKIKDGMANMFGIEISKGSD